MAIPPLTLERVSPMTTLNLKAYIGARRYWAGKDADRHEACNVTIWHPTLIVGGGHLADLRIDAARALVALAEQTSADKVLIEIANSVKMAESQRKRIAADGTGRVRAKAAPINASTSPLLGAEPTPEPSKPCANKRGTRIATNAPAAPTKDARVNTVLAGPART